MKQQAPASRRGPAPARSPVGPYSGPLSRLVGYMPPFMRGFVTEAGGMAGLLAKILWSAVRHPTGYWGAVLEEMHWTIKRSWFPIAAAVFGFLVFTSTIAVGFFDMVGAAQLFGPMLYLHSTRTFTIWVNSIVVAGVIGAAMTADIGARKVREELDAMQVMGIDPVRELAVPKVVSLTLITILLSTPSMIITLLSMQLAAAYVTAMPAADFYSNVFSNLKAVEVGAVVVNSLFVGLLIGAVCAYKGFTAQGGAIGLGRAVNQAVVIASLAVFVLQLFYQSLVLGLYPNAGEFR